MKLLKKRAMKTKLIFTMLIVLSSFAVYAQCNATLTGPTLEFVPAANTSLPDAIVSQVYDENIEVFVPSRDQIGADSVDVVYYTITAFRNGPAGFYYSTTATGNLFTPGSNCININSTEVPSSVGTFNTFIRFNKAGVNSLGDTIYSVSDTLVRYSLNVVYGTPRAVATVNGSVSICEGDVLTFSPQYDYSHATYSWSAAGATRVGSPTKVDTFMFPSPGVYDVILTASDVGTAYDTITVNVTGYPSPSVSTMGFSASCGGSAVLAYSSGGTFKVDSPQPGYTYQWYVDGGAVGGATDSTYTPALSSGVVVAKIFNGSCEVLSNGFTLVDQLLFDIDLCVVTVDSATGKNLLVWERPSGATCVDSVRIYKETNVTDVYDLIASKDFNDFSTYIDASSDPDLKADKYRLALYGSGIESAPSDAHKTIHLTVNVGQGNARNLIWNSYEGAPVSTYNIYRGTNPTNLSLYASVSGSNTSYTDPNPMGTANIYQIELVLPYACTPSKTGQATTRSNIANDGTTSIDDNELLDNLTIAPNPAKGLVTITAENMDIATVKMFSLDGKQVLNMSNFGLNAASTIDVSNILPGLYVVSVELENGSVLNKKLLVE